LNKSEDALVAISSAIDIFDNFEEDKYKLKEDKIIAAQSDVLKLQGEAAKFNRIQYQNFLASCLFMKGDNWTKCIE
jgi:hypothetical protein